MVLFLQELAISPHYHRAGASGAAGLQLCHLVGEGDERREALPRDRLSSCSEQDHGGDKGSLGAWTCGTLLQAFGEVKVGWVRRSANGGAHILAREGCMNNLCKTWFRMPVMNSEFSVI